MLMVLAACALHVVRLRISTRRNCCSCIASKDIVGKDKEWTNALCRVSCIVPVSVHFHCVALGNIESDGPLFDSPAS